MPGCAELRMLSGLETLFSDLLSAHILIVSLPYHGGWILFPCSNSLGPSVYVTPHSCFSTSAAAV